MIKSSDVSLTENKTMVLQEHILAYITFSDPVRMGALRESL